MLGQVLSDKPDQFIESIEIGDLSMRTYHISIYYADHPFKLKGIDSAPESSLATPWIRGNSGFFRINVAIVSPQSDEPQSDFPLSGSEFEAVSKAITDIVKLLEEKLR